MKWSSLICKSLVCLVLATPAVAEDADPQTPWSFEPIAEVTPPETDSEWARNAIDAFALRAMEERGLTPSPDADKRTIIRRLYLDVLGLPPTPERVEAFVYDHQPDAYDRLVDEVLASPHYGERWARHWLDVVRFAETNGFETNTPRKNAWPYRDYVINALNADIPYDQFVREQLAGDALGADAATSFLVGGPNDMVKSPDIVLTKNQRDSELDDMISTTAATFLGLTLRCAKCHDHKFDPIAQSEYFAMRSLIQGVQHGERTLRPPDAEERLAKAADVKKQIEEIDAKLAAFRPKADTKSVFLDDEPGPHFELLVEPESRKTKAPGNETYTGSLPDPAYHRWFAEANTALCRWTPGLTGDYAVWMVRPEPAKGEITAKLAASVKAQLDAPKNVIPIAGGNLTLVGHMTLDEASTFTLHAADTQHSDSGMLILVPLADATTPALREPVNALGNVERFDPVEAKFVRISIAKTSTIEPCIDELEIFEAGTGKNLALASLGAKPSASTEYFNNTKHKTIHLNDGKYGNSFSWIPKELNSWAQIELAEPATIDRIAWARDREGQFSDRLALDYVIEVALAEGEWQTVATSRDRAAYVQKTDQVRLYTKDGNPGELLAQRKELQEEHDALANFPKVYAGTFNDPGATYILHRGDPMMPKDEVDPGGVKGLGLAIEVDADSGDRDRRLALADYIVNPENPLTARVMVNRIWQYHFGEGIVRTPSDFGIMGVKPSHPELLDWLAREFMDSGWRMKHMHRLILMSSTYRQSSTPRKDMLAIDGETYYLWRYPPRRLEAEPIRDTVLEVSGVLDKRMGGPGYDAFEPNDNYVHVYIPKREFGPEEWRRMIYQFKPRMEQDETFGVFDCPDAAQSAPDRNISTTPLQALNLLNSPFMLQQAELFAKRLAEEASTPADQVNRAFELAFARPPEKDELRASIDFINREGLTMFCRAIYNANEFLYLQ